MVLFVKLTIEERWCILLIKKEEKTQKRKRKKSEIQNISNYEIIQEPITLLSDIFLLILALRPKLRVQEQREDPRHPLSNRYGQYMAHE